MVTFKGLNLNDTFVDVEVAGLSTVADGKAEALAKLTTLQRNALLNFDALYTMQESQMVEQLAQVYAPPSEQPLKESAANIWYSGESSGQQYKFGDEIVTANQRNNYTATRKRENGVNCFDIAVNGPEQLVFKTEKDGARTVRLWLNRDTNASARIRYIPSRVSWLLEVYISRRDDTGRWWNNKQAEHYVHRTVTEESELTVAKYVALYFARAQAAH